MKTDKQLSASRGFAPLTPSRSSAPDPAGVGRAPTPAPSYRLEVRARHGPPPPLTNPGPPCSGGLTSYKFGVGWLFLRVTILRVSVRLG